MEMKVWNRSSLLGLEDLTPQEINEIFKLADSYKKALNGEKSLKNNLPGKRIVNLFLEPSTRTRVAFEIAAKSLSADVITISGNSSSLTKGETLKDTALNIKALGADAIVVRHSSPGSALFLAKTISVPIINAGDGSHEHPSQGLLDIYTLREKFGSLVGKRITILGDILFSRVARSNLWGLKKLGAKVTLAGPSTLVPFKFREFGVNVTHNIDKALKEADAVILLRIQHERQNNTHFPSLEEYTRIFGLNSERSYLLKKKALILHPGPINRDVEIDSTLADSEKSVILEQVTNGIVIRMAILYLCTIN